MGCLVAPNGDDGPYCSNITLIFNNYIAAGLVQEAIELCNHVLFCIVYHGQQADSIDGAQTPLCGGRSYLRQDNILLPPAEDMIDDIGEQSNFNGEMRRPNPGKFPPTKTGFQKFAQKLQKRIIRHQRYLEVIRNHALGLSEDYEQRVVADADVAWLHEHDHIVDPPAAGSLANRKCTSSCPATS